jgi:Tfp pilus assembly protein PilW
MFALRIRRSYRMALLACALVAAFVLSLMAWVGHAPATGDGGGAGAPAVALPTPSAPAATTSRPAATSTARPSSPAAALTGAPPASDLLGKVPSLGSSTDARNGGVPSRRVKLVVSSDALIAALGYKIAKGRPAEFSKQWLESPVTVTTVGYSRGLVAAALAESGPNATYVTCTLYVDGILRSQHTVHGQYKFTACLG